MRARSALGILFVATVLAYSPLLGGGFEFLSWDDTANIVDQPIVNTWSLGNLLAVWNTVALGVYEPLAMMLKSVTVRLFGMQVQPFHLISLALHVANTWLFFALARGLLAHCDDDLRSRLRPDAAALVAALLFALNPLRVEVVAWASGQSYAVAGFFFLLSLLAYVRYWELRGEDGVGRRPALFLALSALAYVCAVLGKSAAIFVPAVLLVLDYYPFRRKLDARLLVEKLPHFAAAAALIWIIVLTTSHAQGHTSIELGIVARIAYACHSVLFHLGKSLWPAVLLPSYTITVPDVTLLTS